MQLWDAFAYLQSMQKLRMDVLRSSKQVLLFHDASTANLIEGFTNRFNVKIL